MKLPKNSILFKYAYYGKEDYDIPEKENVCKLTTSFIKNIFYRILVIFVFFIVDVFIWLFSGKSLVYTNSKTNTLPEKLLFLPYSQYKGKPISLFIFPPALVLWYCGRNWQNIVEFTQVNVVNLFVIGVVAILLTAYREVIQIMLHSIKERSCFFIEWDK